MTSKLQKVLLCASSVLLSFLIIEGWLEYREYAERSAFNRQVKPYYSWGLYNSEGRRISNRDGILKLRLAPYVGYSNLPDQNTPYFKINQHGFRGDDFKKRGDKKRVIVVGGSAAFGSGLNSDQATFAAQLEDSLMQVEVINAAVIGYASGQEYALAVTSLMDLDPALIIALDGWNDYHFYSVGIKGAAEAVGESFALMMRLALKRIVSIRLHYLVRPGMSTGPLRPRASPWRCSTHQCCGRRGKGVRRQNNSPVPTE